MIQILQRLGDAFLSEANDDVLLTLSEGFIKVRCAQAALSLGWEIQEGAGERPYGPVADYATLRDGAIHWTRGQRRAMLPEGSADLCIVTPFELFLEIKARPDHGTKSQAQFQEMDADVRRCSQHPNVAFLFLFDERIYQSFSGEKMEKRGRRAVAGAWFNRAFPSAASIPTETWASVTAARDEVVLTLIARRTRHQSPHILVMGGRMDSAVHDPSSAGPRQAL